MAPQASMRRARGKFDSPQTGTAPSDGVASYPPLGAFRLLLALLVMLQHFGANVAPTAFTEVIIPYEVGSVAVLVFFCLSGFVIAEAVDRSYHGRPAAFLFNRTLRIYPPFATALLLAMAVNAWFRAAGTLLIERGDAALPQDAFSPSNVARNFLSVFPGFEHGLRFNFLVIAWALRVEMLFYAAVAVTLAAAAFGARRSGTRGTCAWGAACVLALGASVLAISGYLPPIFGFAPYFVFGGALYATVGKARDATNTCGGLLPRAGPAAALGLSVPLMVLQFLSQPLIDPRLGYHRAIPAQLLLLLALLFGFVFLASQRSSRWRSGDRALGDLTYPLYLNHYAVMVATMSIFPYPSAVALVIGCFASVAVAGAVTAALDPVLRRLRDRVRGHRLDRTSARGAAVRRVQLSGGANDALRFPPPAS